MAGTHVARDLLTRFVRGMTGRQENTEIVRHLLAGCEDCRRLVLGDTPTIDLAAFDAAFEKLESFASAKEQELAVQTLRAGAQWAFLQDEDQESRIAIVRNNPEFRTLGLHRRLLEILEYYCRRDPEAAVDIAGLALVIAETIPELSETGRADLVALTLAHLGNVSRLASMFDSARLLFGSAKEVLETKSGKDPLTKAMLISFEASLETDLGEFELALQKLEGSLQIYRLLNDEHLQGRTYIQMGVAIGYADPERGIAYLRRGLPLITPAREPRLEWCAKHSMAWFTLDAGNPEEALAIVHNSRDVYARYQDAATQARLQWLEGRIALALGEPDTAQAILARVYDLLDTRNLHHEMALVAIDLAETMTQQGTLVGALAVLKRVHRLMRGWKMPTYSLAVWLYYTQLVEAGNVQGVYAQLRTHVRRNWNRQNPWADPKSEA